MHTSRTTRAGAGMRRVLLVAGAALVMLVGTATSAAAQAPAPEAGTASAAATATTTAADDCPGRSLCLYEGTNFTGEMFAVISLVPGGSCVSLVDHGWGDRAHSAVNTHHQSAAMFMNDDCLGGPYQVPGNSSLPSFGTFTPESVWVPYLLA